MRTHLFFISTIVAVLLLMAFATSMLREQNLYRVGGEKRGLSSFLESLHNSQTPSTELNLTAMYTRSDQFEILHPYFAVHALPFRIPTPTCPSNKPDNSSQASPPRQCETLAENVPDANLLALAKQREFIRIILKEQIPTEQFLLNPPFVDELGNSYAYEFWREAIAPFNDRAWIRGHLSYYKPNELKEIFSHIEIKNPQFEIISQLSEPEIKAVVEGAPLVLTPKFLLLKNENRLGFSPLSYFVYDVVAVRSKLKDQEYDLLPFSDGTFCAERIGNACWTYSARATMAYVYRYALVVLLLAGAILIILVSLYINSAVDRHKKQTRMRTSLQVLSHEFRTPVSAMLLLIDELSCGANTLSNRDQDLLTKLGSETYRLQRIVEMSRSYLEANTTAKKYNRGLIPSLNDWLGEFCRDFDSRLRFIPLPSDGPFYTDAYWLRFALANLAQNAFNHGKEPVVLRAHREGRNIHLSIEDHGICEFDSLRVMSQAFVKSKRSRGMGLGLEITRTIIRDWGGTLIYRKYPTTFAVILPPDISVPKI